MDFLNRLINDQEAFLKQIEKCNEDYNVIPYLKIFYFYAHQRYLTSMILPLVTFFLAFLFLQTTAD